MKKPSVIKVGTVEITGNTLALIGWAVSMSSEDDHSSAAQTIIDFINAKLSEPSSDGDPLRDEFAKAALTARLARDSSYETWEYAAEEAYAIADAMMKVRERIS